MVSNSNSPQGKPSGNTKTEADVTQEYNLAWGHSQEPLSDTRMLLIVHMHSGDWGIGCNDG